MLIPYQKVRSDAKAPERATDEAVGYDIYASRVLNRSSKEREVIGDLPVTIYPGTCVLIGIGIRFAVPFPIRVEIVPRSGIASKHLIQLLNSPGTLDPDFRGEAGVLLFNQSKEEFTIERDMRVAQLIFNRVEVPVLEEVEELPLTRRGSGGFGSTGLMEIQGGTKESVLYQLKRDRYYMEITQVTAKQSDCIRGIKETGRPTRQFGCIIVKDQSIISSACNGFYPGQTECTKNDCIRESSRVGTGMGIEVGGCSHAEELALACLARLGSGVSTIGSTIYVNAEPCIKCAKTITLAAPEAVVVPKGAYPNNGVELLRRAGIIVRYITMTD